MAKLVVVAPFEWVQYDFGMSLIIKLKDRERQNPIDLENYEFYVNVRRGENPKNLYTAPCRLVDVEERRIEYVVREGDLDVGDCYYYIDLQGVHNDNNTNDNYNDERKTSSQEVLKVWVRKAKTN